jgi:hypothetical protein
MTAGPLNATTAAFPKASLSTYAALSINLDQDTMVFAQVGKTLA